MDVRGDFLGPPFFDVSVLNTQGNKLENIHDM